MKKYMIRCDMEGVSGVVSYAQAEPGNPEYGFGRRMFMSDLLALVEGLNAGGADEIVVYDEHWHGRNIELDRLPENVSAICGKPPYRPDWAGGLDNSFAGLILLGFHSKAGTGELLHHSYEPDIADLRLNDVSVGEIGMEAAIAGDFLAPLLLIAGDSAGVAEAQRLVPGVIGVAVKDSHSATGALCRSSSATAARIHAAAAGIVHSPPDAAPYRCRPPIRLSIRFHEGNYAKTFQGLFRSRMTVDTAITLTGDTVTELWAEYWQMKLRSRKELP